MKQLCQGVLAGVLLLSGCYRMHGLPDAGAVFEPDAAIRPDVPARDAFVPLDTPSECPLLRPDATCLSSFAMIAGRPFELPFQFDALQCCTNTSCDVSVDEASRTLRLTTGLCPDRCDCEPTRVARGACAVPPIDPSAAGQWTVEVNGTAAFSIGVIPDEPGLFPPPPGCATYAEVDDCGEVPDLTTGPVRDACVELEQRDDREVLTLSRPCWNCGLIDSACEVIVNPRLTDDLLPGGDITLHARDYWTACDVDCPAVCIEHERTCELPPLVPGDFYRVFVDGEVVLTFVEGEPSLPCERR